MEFTTLALDANPDAIEPTNSRRVKDASDPPHPPKTIAIALATQRAKP